MMIDTDSGSDSDDPIPSLQPDEDISIKTTPSKPQHSGEESQKQLQVLPPKGAQQSFNSSIESLLEEDAADMVATTLQNKQLYLLVARCIAYPFNAKLHVETAPSKPKLTEAMYNCIHEVLKQCVNQDKILLQQLILNNSELKCIRNGEFQAMVEFYINVILLKNEIKVICFRGCFSTKELENIFRVLTFKHFRGLLLFQGLVSSTENVTKRIEADPNFQVWISTFSKLVELGRQNSMSSKQRKELNKQLTAMQMGSKDDMYKMFQDILGVSRKDHQSLVQICLLTSSEEQEGIVRRELQKRKELVEKKVLPSFWNTQSYILKDHYLQEQDRNLKILTENLENESLISSDFGLKQKKKKTDDSGEVEPSKHDVDFNKKVKVTVRSLSKITSNTDDKPILIVFDVVDGDKPLATETKEVDSSGCVIFDTNGEFWTQSPLPQISFKVKLLTQGLIHEHRPLGKVIHTVVPSTSEIPCEVPVTRDEKHPTPVAHLKISTFLERPTNMRKCGYLNCQGSYIFKERKSRFLALILLSQFRFLLCHYLPRDKYPRDLISLDGCNVDYLNKDDPILSGDLPYGFVLTTSKGTVKFACKTYNERETWVNGLFQVTGQSNKPSDDLDGESGTCAIKGSELADVVDVDVTQLDHQQLFTKLFKAILSYRLDQPVFSRGLFSSSQMFIIDEYCARYSVRLSHRHLTCLREWLSCELKGINIWPVMILHSFGFCQMHIMGKAPQQYTEVVTPQERIEWSELSAQIELLLTEKLENFRTYFPFSCPKDDLKITMKLFTLVADINHCDEGNVNEFAALFSQTHPLKLLNQIMETAALNNFKDIYFKLSNNEMEEGNVVLNVEQIYVLAKLCIEFMYELHDFYNEDFILYPSAFSTHIDAFWSFFMVDLKETMNSVSDEDVIPLLKTFYTLNEYFILQPTLKLCPFHTNLLSLFLPIVDRYLTELDVSISNDMKAFFDNESWMPVSECCNSMKGCIDALESVKKFVENLHWPEEPFSSDLIYNVQSICAEKFKSAVRFTRLQCESSAKAMSISFDTVVPKPLITMINTMMFLSVQAVPFCGLSEISEGTANTNRQSDLCNELKSYLETSLGDSFRTVIHKLCEPLQIILKQMARLDPQTGLLSSLKSMIPSSIQTEQYQQFLKMNFQHLSGTLVVAVFQQFMLNWYETQLRIVARWLRNRPDFSLHPTQLDSSETLLQIIRDQFHQDEDMEEEQLRTESYEEIEDRIKRERSQAVMMKAFKKQ